MSPNPPLYMLKKAPRFIPGLGTLTLLAVGGFVVGRSSVKDSNVSTAEPAQRTPWPPPLNDALDDDIRPYVRSRFQTSEVSHRGRQSECTDRDWVTFSDPSGTAAVYELHRLVRADGTNDCMRRIWLTTTNRHTEPLYLTRREVGLFNGPVQKFEAQTCKKKDDDGR
ncbi:Exopolysaccharide regulatory protein Exor [Lasiodiplodia theobromae]|uniref:Exopolysaccharide regulatory protein Exor n=1 Tax=Lasiodiplodia theobromae TaxID=45133 RepID=UPI0015C398EA|nr:Exopolysaccharide regulatory protein Exor [Lasiodiplodia theobromae]KAF4540388.1 Exopolysaccharide regulatory protein Exor [Lasiodiplodia theobromae]